MRLWITVEGLHLPTRLIIDEEEQRLRKYPYRLTFLHNTVLVCPLCGDSWGKWQMEDTPKAEWFADRMTCPKHEKGWAYQEVPGSLLNTWEMIVLPVLPRELLERELLLCTNPLLPREVSEEPSLSTLLSEDSLSA